MRAVDKRAGELTTEYLAKARRTDQTYCGTNQGEVGPVERKLGTLGRIHGIVVGAFGEASDDLHSLIWPCPGSGMLVLRRAGGAN